MRRVLLMLATASAAWTLAACGGTEVTVTAHLEQQSAATGEMETAALGSLPVRILPFDRDAVFDSLSNAYPEPEPQIPDSIFDLQQRVIEAQQQWQQAETRWATLRDSLQTLSDRMASMDQSSGEYFALFQEFNSMESEVNTLEERSNTMFDEFTSLQERLNTQSREISLARQNWADEAFASVDSVFQAKYEQLGLEERWDTTNAQGVAYFRGVPSGTWWVSARYERQFDQLYWNVPVEVSGDQVEVELTADNAEVRQQM